MFGGEAVGWSRGIELGIRRIEGEMEGEIRLVGEVGGVVVVVWSWWLDGGDLDCGRRRTWFGSVRTMMLFNVRLNDGQSRLAV